MTLQRADSPHPRGAVHDPDCPASQPCCPIGEDRDCMLHAENPCNCEPVIAPGRVQPDERRPYESVERESMQGHNHLTRDIKDRGWCPACDYWWERSEETNDD